MRPASQASSGGGPDPKGRRLASLLAALAFTPAGPRSESSPTRPRRRSSASRTAACPASASARSTRSPTRSAARTPTSSATRRRCRPPRRSTRWVPAPSMRWVRRRPASLPLTGPRPLFSNGGLCTLDYTRTTIYSRRSTWTPGRRPSEKVRSMSSACLTRPTRTTGGRAPVSAASTFSRSPYRTPPTDPMPSCRSSPRVALTGTVHRPIYNTPRFLYTPNPLGGGCGSPYNLVPLAYNHNYYLRVDNFNAGGYNYWEYCVNDLTAGSGTKCLAAINSSA